MPTRSALAFGVIYLGLVLGQSSRCEPPAARDARAVKAERPSRADRYGDPLPKGALMRLGTLRFCQPFPGSLAFSPDGKVLASGGSDNRIRLWDPDTGKEVRTLEGHKGSVNCIALSADGRWLASGSQDNTLRLWEVSTGKERRQFQGHDAPIERMALSPDGKALASSCLGGTLRLWDTDTGKQIRSLPIDPGARIGAMAFTPDGKHLAFVNHFAKGIQLVDVAEGKVTRTFQGHKDNIRSLVFSADGATLLSGSADRTIRAWDVASGEERRSYGDAKAEVSCLALAPDGKTLTYGTYPDGMVHIWDIAANKHLVAPWFATPWCVVSIAYSPDGKKVAVGRDTIAIHETATGKRLNPPPENDSRIEQVEYSTDGNMLAVGRQDQTIELWRTAEWRKVATIRAINGQFSAMAFCPGGKYLTTAEGHFNRGRIEGAIRHWDPRTGKRLQEFRLDGGWLEALSYSADGETLACLQRSSRKVFVLLDAATGTERGRITDRDPSGRNAQLSPGGRLLACGTSANAVTLWDTKAGKVVRAFGRTFPGAWELLAFSADGRTIATPGCQVVDRGNPVQPDIVLWETTTGQERLHIAVKDEPVRQMAFSPDGRLLASAGWAETIHLWDSWTGKEVGRFTGHRGAIRSLSFAPDGKTLASGGHDSTVLIWDVSGLLSAAQEPAAQLGRHELAGCWDDLAGTDAARAYRAIAELARRPGQAEGLLRDKLASDPGVSAERLARLIAALDADDFKARENASKELAKLGRLAEGALRKVLEGNPSAEARRRVRVLLAKLDGQADDPKQVRLLRAVELLERLGTPEARRLLGELAKGATEAEAAREARASLRRMGKVGRNAP